MFYRMRLFYRMNFFNSDLFFELSDFELNFLKGDTNIHFKQKTFFEKKKKKVKIFFSQKYIFLKLSSATFEKP